MKFEDQRRIMVERHIAGRGIDNPKILAAFEKIPRHIFVPEELQRLSYQDSPLSIGKGQTISQPFIVALMLDLLDLNEEDTVLEIGTGSGYQTALLAEIVKQVFTVERIPELLSKARDIIDSLGYENVYYRVGDGTRGWEKAFPVRKTFNKIVVSAAAPDIPQKLLDQLSDHGVLIIPAGSRYWQKLLQVTKQGNKLEKKEYGQCTFVPLIGNEGWNNQ